MNNKQKKIRGGQNDRLKTDFQKLDKPLEEKYDKK